jgi:hypothetical protein
MSKKLFMEEELVTVVDLVQQELSVYLIADLMRFADPIVTLSVNLKIKNRNVLFLALRIKT